MLWKPFYSVSFRSHLVTMSDVADKQPDPTTAPEEEKKPEEPTTTTEESKPEESKSEEQKPEEGAASKTTDSVFSMFGGGPKKEKKEEPEEGQDEPSGSSKAQKGEEVCFSATNRAHLTVADLMNNRKRRPRSLLMSTSSPSST